MQIDPLVLFGEGLALCSGRFFDPAIQQYDLGWLKIFGIDGFAWKGVLAALMEPPRQVQAYSYADGNPSGRFDPDGWWCGAGAEGSLGEITVSDTPFGFNFDNCCKGHDIDYATCGVIKETADRDFYECMMGVVAISKRSGFWKWLGRQVAYLYFAAARDFGHGVYRRQQKKNCHCQEDYWEELMM